MNPFRNRPTQTRAPATGWASAAPWAQPNDGDRDNARPSPTAGTNDDSSIDDSQESFGSGSWGY